MRHKCWDLVVWKAEEPMIRWMQKPQQRAEQASCCDRHCDFCSERWRGFLVINYTLLSVKIQAKCFPSRILESQEPEVFQWLFSRCMYQDDIRTATIARAPTERFASLYRARRDTEWSQSKPWTVMYDYSQREYMYIRLGVWTQFVHELLRHVQGHK